MTLPVSLNPFPNPVPGMDLPATILNVRGQDNAIADTLNAVILALGGGGLPIVINASQVTAGTFGAGNYVFPANLDVVGTLTTQGQFSQAFGVKATTSNQFAAFGTGDANAFQLIVSSNTNLSMQIQALEQNVAFRTLKLNPTGGTVELASAGLNTAVLGTLGVAQDFAVNGSKFTVDHATGNTAIAGTLAVGGTNFTVAASGNSTIGGTLQVSGLITASQGVSIAGSETLTFGTSSVVAGAPTWSSDQAITLATAAQPNITSVGTLVGLTVSGGSLISRNDFIVGIGTTFKVSAITGNTAIVGNVGIGSLGPTSTSPLNIQGLPTSAVGLVAGDIYSLSGILHIA